MLESSIKESKESSWKILWNNPFTVYLTLCTCIGLAFLGYYTGIIIHVLYVHRDFQSLLQEAFVGTGMIWAIFGATIGCWANVDVSRAIPIADTLIFLGGGMISADCSVAGKLYLGIGIGMVSMASPLFISKATSPHKTTRVLIVSTHCLFFAFGNYFSFYLIYHGLFATAQEQERTTHLISLTRFAALLQLFLISFISPESPVWIFIEKPSIDSPMIKRNDIATKSTTPAVGEKCSDRGTRTSGNINTHYDQELHSEFNSISTTTLTRDCMEVFSEERYRLKEILSSTRVCLTTDMWSSLTNLGYICLTAHYVDKGWKPQKKIINFSGLQYPHTAELIAQAVERCLLNWGIKDVNAITLGNTKFNDRQGINCLMQNLDGFLSQGECFHVRCFAHIIKLVVNDSINGVIHLIRRLRKHVKYITSSPSHLKIFQQCASAEGIITKKYLCLDVKTEWDTTYLMLGEAIMFSKAFERMAEQDFSYKQEFESNGIGHMDENHWKVIESLHIFLEHFYLTTKRIFGSNCITSNVYFDELTTIKDRLLEHLANADPFLRNMALKMNQNFDKYCSIDEVNPILVIAMVLDPRYKLHYVEFWYARYYEKTNDSLNKEKREEKVSVFIESLKNLMSLLYLQYKIESSDCIETEFVDICGIRSRENTLNSELSEFLRNKGSVQALSDLERYLQDDVEPMTNDFHILSWWKEKVQTYGALAVMARDVLTIPVTSVAPDWAFSTAEKTLDPFCSSLTPEMVECLICTQDWLADAELNKSFDAEENIEML